MARSGGIPGFTRRPLSDLLVLGTDEEKRDLAGELDNQLDEIYAYLSLILGATGGTTGGTLAPGGEPYVLHGPGPIPSTLSDAKLHRNLLNADSDIHEPRPHASSHHPASGTDPIDFWAHAIVPAGVINGVNDTFTLNPPGPSIAVANSLFLINNSGFQIQGLHYTLAGDTITFGAIYIPHTNDALRAWYIKV